MSGAAPETLYDGQHLIADLHGCSGLEDARLIEQALRDAAAAAGATVLEVRLHSFGGSCGVTGMALLAESHISVHSWPERGYAAIDIFLCGARHDPEQALEVIIAALQAERIEKTIISRGYGMPEIAAQPSQRTPAGRKQAGASRVWSREQRR